MRLAVGRHAVGQLAGLVAGLAAALAAGCAATAHPPAGPSASPSCAPRATTAGSVARLGNPARSPVLSAVRFVSASAGWAAGSDRILHTADGGRRWMIQYRAGPAARLGTVDFIDASHGWVTGAAEVLATADGGAHWHTLPEPCQLIRTVHFVSPDDGFAVAGGNLPGPAVPGADVPPTGGVLLRTTDGGERWRPVATPPDVQTACFSDAERGWLGAAGNIYGTANGGRSWTLAVRGPGRPGSRPDTHAVAEVECAGSGAAWAELNGPGAALSHLAQIGYHTSGRTWQPIFAEQYTASPGMRARVRTDAPSVYPGPFSAIGQDQAVFIGWCPPCSSPASPRLQGTAPLDLALHAGSALLRRGPVSKLSQATGAAFVTASDGWVVGIGQARRTVSMIMHTADGGRSWQRQYVLRP